MKLKTPDAVAARARSPINWFLGICLAAFLTIISASAAALSLHGRNFLASGLTKKYELGLGDGVAARQARSSPSRASRKLASCICVSGFGQLLEE
jgi:hypothetical protein